MICTRQLITKLNVIRKNKLGNMNILVSVCLSAIFLGMSKNEEDINKAIFWMPLISYIYSYVISKKPILLVLYLLCFYISKKITDKSR